MGKPGDASSDEGAVTDVEAKGLYLTLVGLKTPLRPGARVEVILVNETQCKTRRTAVVGP